MWYYELSWDYPKLGLVHFGKKSEPKVISASFSWFQPRKKPATSWHPDQFLSNGVKNQSGNLGNAWGRFKHRNAGFFSETIPGCWQIGGKGGYSAILTYSDHVQHLGCTVRKLRNGQTPNHLVSGLTMTWWSEHERYNTSISLFDNGHSAVETKRLKHSP